MGFLLLLLLLLLFCGDLEHFELVLFLRRSRVTIVAS